MKIVAAKNCWLGDKEHSESEFSYREELQFNEESESIALSYERVGAGHYQQVGRIYDEIETFLILL